MTAGAISTAHIRLTELRGQANAIRAEIRELQALISQSDRQDITDRNKAIVNLRDQGALYKDIAKQFGLSATMVGKIVKRMAKERLKSSSGI